MATEIVLYRVHPNAPADVVYHDPHRSPYIDSYPDFTEAGDGYRKDYAYYLRCILNDVDLFPGSNCSDVVTDSHIQRIEQRLTPDAFLNYKQGEFEFHERQGDFDAALTERFITWLKWCVGYRILRDVR